MILAHVYEHLPDGESVTTANTPFRNYRLGAIASAFVTRYPKEPRPILRLYTFCIFRPMLSARLLQTWQFMFGAGSSEITTLPAPVSGMPGVHGI